MNFYCFKVKDVKQGVEKSFKKVSEGDEEYISYENYLESEYSTSVQENGEINNEDYIAQLKGNSAIMVLGEKYFDMTDLDNIFEILIDKLGDAYEKNHNCEWALSGR